MKERVKRKEKREKRKNKKNTKYKNPSQLCYSLLCCVREGLGMSKAEQRTHTNEIQNTKTFPNPVIPFSVASDKG